MQRASEVFQTPYADRVRLKQPPFAREVSAELDSRLLTSSHHLLPHHNAPQETQSDVGVPQEALEYLQDRAALHSVSAVDELEKTKADLALSSPNTAGFKTKNPAKPDDTPIAATLDDVQHVGGQHSGNQQRGEQSNSTPYAQSEPASSKSNDSSIAFDRPPDSVTHTVHSDEGEYHSTTETPTWVSWTRISYLGSPSASEEIVHAER